MPAGPTPTAWILAGRIPRLIFWSILLLLLLALAAFSAWWATGNWMWMRAFFDYPGVLFFVGCSLLGLRLSYLCWRQFAPGDAMRPAWLLIVLFGLSQLTGGVIGHVLGGESFLNPLYYLASGHGLIRTAAYTGRLFSPISMLFLAAGLFRVVQICRKNGVLAGLKTFDFLLLGIVTVYTIHYFTAVVFSSQHPEGPVTADKIFTWMSDPLLCVLLLQAILIRRSAANMGWGLIARCWVAFTAAIFFTSVGDIGLWASARGTIPFGLQAASWYVWYPATACFAAAPAYQLQAMLRATHGLACDEDLDAVGYQTGRGV
jgi:hypothetical protein